MVKIKSNLGPMSGKLNGMRFYEVNGETIGVTIPTHARNPQTDAQMKQRIKINNILNMYKYIKGYLQYNFEGIVGNKNASSFFRSYNLMQTPVWLTETQKANMLYVLSPYVISQGRIPVIDYAYADGVFYSNINIDNINFANTTPVNILASAICKNNEGWTYGDTLQIMLLRQEIAANDDINIIQPKCFSIEIPLDKNENKPISELAPLDTLSPMDRFELSNINGQLSLKVADTDKYAYAFALVHKRGSGRATIVSSQKLCLSDTIIYDQYTNQEALDNALSSYRK